MNKYNVCLFSQEFLTLLTGNILQKEPQKQVTSYQLGHLSHEHLSRVLHPREGKEKKEKQAAQEELGRQGRLSN